jgi:Zn-dependent M32 family carboxypeptidase
MAETLGTLCDKLTIVKLKQYHSEGIARLTSLAEQEIQLKNEIDEFVEAAINQIIPAEKLTFAANKVYKKEGTPLREIDGSIGEVFSELVLVNCTLWHEQEKVYEFEKIRPEEKDNVVKQLAILNLERNQCIEKIDMRFRLLVESLCNK